MIRSSLGTFTFKKGKSYEVILSNENTEGYVVADAIQVVGLTPEFIYAFVHDNTAHSLENAPKPFILMNRRNYLL